MKKFIRFIFVMLFLGMGALATSALYIVRVPGPEKQVIIVPKNQLGFVDTYVDTRNWSMDDAVKHAAVVQRIIETGKADRLIHLASKGDPRPIDQQLSDAAASAGTMPATSPSSIKISPSARATPRFTPRPLLQSDAIEIVRWHRSDSLAAKACFRRSAGYAFRRALSRLMMIRDDPAVATALSRCRGSSHSGL